MFKALFTELRMRQKVVMLTRNRHNCVALIHKKTVLSLETSSIINFEFINFLKKYVKCLPLTKTIREYQIFGNLRFITIFDNLFLPNQVDLSAHCS